MQTERVFIELREIARRDVANALRVWDLGLSPDSAEHPATHPALNYGGLIVVPLSPDQWVVLRKPEPGEVHVMCCPGARVAHTMPTEDVAQVLAAQWLEARASARVANCEEWECALEHLERA